MARIAINGFGRIGRSILRAMAERQVTDLQVMAVNDLAPLDQLAHLLEFDSVHGRFPGPIRVEGDSMDIGFGPIRFSRKRDPGDLPWEGIDLALECTGAMNNRTDASRHLSNGAGRVLVSGPCDDADRMLIMGVNEGDLQPDDRLISNASCTTNCLGPLVRVLDEAFGLVAGDMTTVHCYTNSQPLSDQPHSDWHRSRAAALSMIPTTTSAIDLLTQALPGMAGKLKGSAIRVPTPNVSCVELKFQTSAPCTPDTINQAMRTAALGPLSGILEVTEKPLVSIDHNHNRHSAIFACDQTRSLPPGMHRILAWYDNEWGFSNRMIDMARHINRAS